MAEFLPKWQAMLCAAGTEPLWAPYSTPPRNLRNTCNS